uniref:Uncharacterized protein n=1 Tax=Mesocestoides corti TaxID=53468 RepID=A0A5K3G4F7_MESCO
MRRTLPTPGIARIFFSARRKFSLKANYTLFMGGTFWVEFLWTHCSFPPPPPPPPPSSPCSSSSCHFSLFTSFSLVSCNTVSRQLFLVPGATSNAVPLCVCVCVWSA